LRHPGQGRRAGSAPSCAASRIARIERNIAVGRGRWRTRVETRSALRADAAAFHLENTVTAYEGEQRVFTRTWTRSVPRDLV